MISGWDPAYISLAAAAVGAMLGILVLIRNPARGVNRLFFAFSIVSGATFALAALNTLNLGTAAALHYARTFWYFDPWLSAFLVLLALHIPTPRGVLLRQPAGFLIHAAILLPAAVVTVAYAMDQSILIHLAHLGSVPYYKLTPAGIALIGVRALAVAAAVLILANRFRRTPHALQRTQLAWAQAALVIGFTPEFALFFVKQVAQNPMSTAVIGFGVGTAVIHLAILGALRPWNTSLFQDPDRQVVAVSAVGSASLTVAIAFVSSEAAVLSFVSLASLAYPLILAYAILKFDLFGLDVRVKQMAPHALLGLFIFGAFMLFFGLAANLSPAKAAVNHVLAAGVLTSAAAIPLRQATTHLATRFGWTRAHEPAALAERRLEIYRAAVENEVTRGEDVEASETLRDLRERLALTTRDHRVMVRVVRDGTGSDRHQARGPLREGDFVMRKYRVDRLLGTGSFGRALLATQVSVNRKVVIKEPHEMYCTRGALSALSREAKLAARVNHPNVVTLLDFEELENTGYLVFEHVAGGSLENRLQHGRLPRPEAYALFRDMLLGLDAIHRARIVHMDLKPANILLDAEGRAKISDFGIAREVRMDVAATLGRSMDGQAHPGTLLYMAPEQVRGRRDPGPVADLYAAGAILHEMLTGHRYLDVPQSPPLIQDAILYKEPRLDDPHLTPAEQDLLQALLAKAPADRPQSAREVLARLPPTVEGNTSKESIGSNRNQALKEV